MVSDESTVYQEIYKYLILVLTTYVKHFISTMTKNSYNNYCINETFSAGYGNTTSAVNAIQF
jgi:hypothetical protein